MEYSKILLFTGIVMIFSGLMFIPSDVEGKKSSGTYLTEIGSKKICGDKLCDAPQSIEEKIAAFLESKVIRQGGVDQQAGRFSEGGVSQQAYDSSKHIFKGNGIYVNDVLGFSINPHSFENVNDLDESFYRGNIIFTTSKSDYQNFPSFFTITKTEAVPQGIPSSSLFKDQFIQIYSEGLKSNSVVSDVQIKDSSFSEKSNSYTVKFSGEISNLLGSKTIPTSFAMIVLFSESGTYSFNLNSNPIDFEKSLKEFNKSYNSFKIIKDSKEKMDSPKNEKAQKAPSMKDQPKKAKGEK